MRRSRYCVKSPVPPASTSSDRASSSSDGTSSRHGRAAAEKGGAALRRGGGARGFSRGAFVMPAAVSGGACAAKSGLKPVILWRGTTRMACAGSMLAAGHGGVCRGDFSWSVRVRRCARVVGGWWLMGRRESDAVLCGVGQGESVLRRVATGKEYSRGRSRSSEDFLRAVRVDVEEPEEQFVERSRGENGSISNISSGEVVRSEVDSGSSSWRPGISIGDEDFGG